MLLWWNYSTWAIFSVKKKTVRGEVCLFSYIFVHMALLAAAAFDSSQARFHFLIDLSSFGSFHRCFSNALSSGLGLRWVEKVFQDFWAQSFLVKVKVFGVFYWHKINTSFLVEKAWTHPAGGECAGNDSPEVPLTLDDYFQRKVQFTVFTRNAIKSRSLLEYIYWPGASIMLKLTLHAINDRISWGRAFKIVGEHKIKYLI